MRQERRLTRKQRNTIILIILFLPILAGDIALVAGGKLPLVEMGLPFALSFSFFIALYFVLRRRDGQKVEGDERSQRIEGRAFAYSWYLALYAIVLLMLNDTLGLVAISIGQCLFCILGTMLAAFWIIKAVLNRRGDIED